MRIATNFCKDTARCS